MSYLRKYSWVLPIIGAIIVLISLFTPTTYNYRYGTDLYYVWMTQIAVDIEPGPIEPYLLPSRMDFVLILFSYSFTIIIFSSALILIIITNLYRKYTINYRKLRWKWLILAILISISTLSWIIMMEVYYNLQNATHWQNYLPFFGILGPFIGSALIIIGMFLARDNGVSSRNNNIT